MFLGWTRVHSDADKDKVIIHSFIFSNHFTLVKADVDPEPILGTLGVWWEYTLDRIYPNHTKPKANTTAQSGSIE